MGLRFEACGFCASVKIDTPTRPPPGDEPQRYLLFRCQGEEPSAADGKLGVESRLGATPPVE
ncbi:hypothetical protein GCM10022421_34290 [Oceanisphaera sediminis]|uniref:Uncharacterized protein n=1 Tax=Oceanisphaera sediminis TaxID=981381 RepID=A0ABP7ESN2_9GAMM